MGATVLVLNRSLPDDPSALGVGKTALHGEVLCHGEQPRVPQLQPASGQQNGRTGVCGCPRGAAGVTGFLSCLQMLVLFI